MVRELRTSLTDGKMLNQTFNGTLCLPFQVRGHPLQEAALRLLAAPPQHQDRVQGQLQVRGPGAGRHQPGQPHPAGRGVREDRQVLPHLIPHTLLHLQHHLLAGIHPVGCHLPDRGL